MSRLVRGELQTLRFAQDRELSQLLRLISLPDVRPEDLGRNYYWQVQGSFRGAPCKVVGIKNYDMTRSVSIVFPLASPTKLRLRFQNTESVRLLLWPSQRGVDATEQAERVDPRLLRPGEASELLGLGVPFVLTLLKEQLTMTIYGIYQGDFYRDVLGLLYAIYLRVGDLTEISAAPAG